MNIAEHLPIICPTSYKKLFEKDEKTFRGVPSIGYSFWYNKAIKSEGNKPTQNK